MQPVTSVMPVVAATTFEFLRSGIMSIWARPILLLTLCTIPLVLAAVFRRSYPNKPLVALFAVPTVLSALLMAKLDLLPLVIAFDCVIALVAFWDLFTTPGKKSFSVTRNCMRIASLQKPHPVELTVTHTGRNSKLIWVRDDVPQEFKSSPDEFTIQIKPRVRAHLHYDLSATRRGAFEMRRVYIRTRSRLGLWRRHLELPVDSSIHVYPDMQQLSKYALLARTNRLSQIGVRRTRKIGQDNEFERLRDYTLDDNYKHLDWRATARRNKLTVKDFQSSQSQRVIFLVDTGRMMSNLSSEGLSLLDHALNSMLMLSYVALQRGDSVGMIAFSDSIHSFVPPKGGMNQMNQLLHASFDRFPGLVESRYDHAFRYLSSRCQKRSLVVLMTNVIDEVNANQVHQYLGSIAGRHLPLGVLMRDHRLFDAADQGFPSGEKLFSSAAAAEILTWRHQVITALEHQGVLSVDVFPEEMTAPLVNRYLEIKARHLL